MLRSGLGIPLARERLGHHFIRELLAHLALQQPPAVLGEHRGIEAGLHQAHVQEPAEKQMTVQLFAEGPLAADRLRGHGQRGLQELFGRGGGPARIEAEGAGPLQWGFSADS